VVTTGAQGHVCVQLIWECARALPRFWSVDLRVVPSAAVHARFSLTAPACSKALAHSMPLGRLRSSASR
jgi:hypothetical protein